MERYSQLCVLANDYVEKDAKMVADMHDPDVPMGVQIAGSLKTYKAILVFIVKV